MTPEQAQQFIAFLSGLDYSRQEDRNAAVSAIESLRQYPQLPREVADAVAQANARLQQPGGVTGTTPSDYRSAIFGIGTPATLIDELGVILGAINELDTTAGRRYIDALVSAVNAGDPAAMTQLESILADEDVSERTRAEVGASIERVQVGEGGPLTPAAAEADEPVGTVPPPSGPMEPAAADMGAEPDMEAGAPGLDFDAQLGGGASGIVGFYGVPLQTLDDEGTVVPWEAIVNGEGVAPRYAEGYSRQPGRFGFVNEEQIARVQFQMEAAGLLEPGSYMPGVWDARTAGRSNTEGWRAVLAFSNMNGLDWEQGFARLYDAGTDASARGLQMELDRLNRQPFFADPTVLRERTRQYLLRMGRRPNQISDEELDSLTEAAVYGSQAARAASLEGQIEQRTAPMGGTIAMDDYEMDPTVYFDQELQKLTGREMESRLAQQEAETGAQDFARIAGTIGSAG